MVFTAVKLWVETCFQLVARMLTYLDRAVRIDLFCGHDLAVTKFYCIVIIGKAKARTRCRAEVPVSPGALVRVWNGAVSASSGQGPGTLGVTLLGHLGSRWVLWCRGDRCLMEYCEWGRDHPLLSLPSPSAGALFVSCDTTTASELDRWWPQLQGGFKCSCASALLLSLARLQCAFGHRLGVKSGLVFGQQAKHSGRASWVSCCGVTSRVPSGKSFSHSLCLTSRSAKWCRTLPLRGFVSKNMPNPVSCAAFMAVPRTRLDKSWHHDQRPLGPLGVLLLLLRAAVRSRSAQRKGPH